MGIISRKSNLKIAIIINNAKIVKAIEFDKNGRSSKLKVKIIFTKIGTKKPIIINSDCFEKKPEFFIENTMR